MIHAIIQARLSSTRLPGKVLQSFSGNTLLGHIIERLSFSKHISKVVVATTSSAADDTLIEWLKSRNIPYYRGDESDVLNRYFEAAKNFGSTHIARITSDDPFKDPEIIDKVATLYLKKSLDFAYNNNPPTFAEGLDTEIFSFEALTRANQDASDPFEREHVTQHFYRNPGKFRQENLVSNTDFSDMRWTVDTASDMEMAREVYRHLYRKGSVFLANDILELLKQKPEIQSINQNVKRSDMYKNKKS